jgi:hypothetical protein
LFVLKLKSSIEEADRLRSLAILQAQSATRPEEQQRMPPHIHPQELEEISNRIAARFQRDWRRPVVEYLKNQKAFQRKVLATTVALSGILLCLIAIGMLLGMVRMGNRDQVSASDLDAIRKELADFREEAKTHARQIQVDELASRPQPGAVKLMWRIRDESFETQNTVPRNVRIKYAVTVVSGKFDSIDLRLRRQVTLEEHLAETFRLDSLQPLVEGDLAYTYGNRECALVSIRFVEASSEQMKDLHPTKVVDGGLQFGTEEDRKKGLPYVFLSVEASDDYALVGLFLRRK